MTHSKSISVSHTPGPWKYATNVGPTAAAIVETDGTSILDIRNRLRRGAEFEANARLIAAAPELLAALQAVMNGQLCGSVDLDAERFQMAREAIAKAVQS